MLISQMRKLRIREAKSQQINGALSKQVAKIRNYLIIPSRIKSESGPMKNSIIQ